MAGKEFPLSITLRSVDRATPGIRRLHSQLQGLAGSVRRAGSGMATLGRGAMGGIRGAIGGVRSLATSMGVVAGAAGAAVYAFKKITDEGDQLAKMADQIGVSVDALAQLRFAASQSGVDVGTLDGSLESFVKVVGQARAGTGRFAGFLKKVSPELLKQIKAAGSTEDAFGLMADAMVKLEDPSKQAALAMAAGFDPKMLNLLKLGRAGVAELRAEFLKLAGPQEAQARASEKVNDAFGRIGAATQGVKASIITSLEPTFLDFAGKATAWLDEHRATIGEWAKDFGEKLPGRIEKMLPALQLVASAVGMVSSAVLFLVNKLVEAKEALDRLAGADEANSTNALQGAAEARARKMGLSDADAREAGRRAVRAMGAEEIVRHGASEGGAWSYGDVGERGGLGAQLAQVGRWFRHGDQGNRFLLPGSTIQAARRLSRTGSTVAPDVLGSRQNAISPGAMAPSAAPPAASGGVTVTVKGLPAGSRATIDPGSKGVDLATGPMQRVVP